MCSAISRAIRQREVEIDYVLEPAAAVDDVIAAEPVNGCIACIVDGHHGPLTKDYLSSALPQNEDRSSELFPDAEAGDRLIPEHRIQRQLGDSGSVDLASQRHSGHAANSPGASIRRF